MPVRVYNLCAPDVLILTMQAEVGQALLEKHEAYVRRHGGEGLSDFQVSLI